MKTILIKTIRQTINERLFFLGGGLRTGGHEGAEQRHGQAQCNHGHGFIGG